MVSKPSPRITYFSWGRIEIEGQSKSFKDAKVFPGGAREWNWNETGTRHEPGIQPADVQELVNKGVKEIILANGVYERLQVCPETLQYLEDNYIIIQILQTEKAVTLYNRLCEDKSVGGLFHTTC